jgi:hypothetical protein
MNIRAGIDPDLGSHRSDEEMCGAAHRLHRDAPPFEICDATDALTAKQSEAAGMDASQDRDRNATIDRGRQR